MANTSENRRVKVFINNVEQGATIKQINDAYRKLNNYIRSELTPGSELYNQKIKELRALGAQIDAHGKKVKGLSGMWASVKTEVKQFGLMMLAYVGAGALLGGLNNMIRKMGEMDDLMQDIRKTTNLSIDEVRNLNAALGTIKTRSSRIELLELAKQAGKLGITGVTAIKAWVEEADKIKTALGEDLGEGAITAIGKLANIFGTSMTKIGSALNEVGASGIASEGWQVDYMSRLSGIAKTAGLTIDQLLGFGATLEENGQTAEVSGTALNKFFVDFVRDTEKFGDAAGFAKGELSKLIGEKGTNEGFTLFLKRLKETSGSSQELLQKLEQLGIDGSRGANVILTLANNTERVAEMQKIANKAYTEGTSVGAEFQKRQEGMGAAIDTVRKALMGAFMNNPIANGIKSLIKGLAGLISPARSAVEEFKEFKAIVESSEERLNPLLARYDELQTASIDNEEAQNDLKKVIQEITEIVPAAATSFDEYGNAVTISTDTVREWLAIQKDVLKIKHQDAIDETTGAMDDLTYKISQANVALKSQQALFDQVQLKMDILNGTIVATTYEQTLLASSMRTSGTTMEDLQKDYMAANESVGKLQATIFDLNSQLTAQKQIQAENLGEKTQLQIDAENAAKIVADGIELTEEEIQKQKELAHARKKAAEEYQKLLEDNFNALKEWNQKYNDAVIETVADIAYALMSEREKEIYDEEQKWQKLIDLAIKYGLDSEKLVAAQQMNIHLLKTKYAREDIGAIKDENAERLSELQKLHAAERTERRKQHDEEIKNSSEITDAEIANRLRAFDATKNILGSLSILIGDKSAQGAEYQRELALFMIGIDTAKAIAAAVAAGQDVPFPLNLLAAAEGVAAVLAGMAQAKQYLDAEEVPHYAAGGDTPGVPTLAMVGERGVEKIYPNWMVSNPQLAPIYEMMDGIRSQGYVSNSSGAGSQTSFSHSVSLDDKKVMMIAGEIKLMREEMKQWKKTLRAKIVFKDVEEPVLKMRKIRNKAKGSKTFEEKGI